MASHIDLIIKGKEKISWEEQKHGGSASSKGDQIKRESE